MVMDTTKINKKSEPMLMRRAIASV